MDLGPLLPFLLSESLPQNNSSLITGQATGQTDFLSLMSSLLGSGDGSSSAFSGMSGETGLGGGAFQMLSALTLLEQLLTMQTQPAVLKPETTQGVWGNLIPQGQFGGDVPSGHPVQGARLTQEYHNGHYALDFGIPVGSSVRSTMNGEVVHAGWNNEGYGNLVIVQNGPYRTYYAHLSEIPVTVGQQVSAGSVIGLSGNTGNSTGPHLHYEIRKDGKAINPTQATLG